MRLKLRTVKPCDPGQRPSSLGIRKSETYKKLGYAIRILIVSTGSSSFETGRAVHYDTIHHYDIPDFILNYITGGAYCIIHACNFKTSKEPVVKKDYEEDYMTIMANAMK